MAESSTVFAEKSTSGIQQHEDAALKTSMLAGKAGKGRKTDERGSGAIDALSADGRKNAAKRTGQSIICDYKKCI